VDDSSATGVPPESSPHPVRLVVSDDLGRSRLTVLFRLFLWLPHLVWFVLWTVAAYVAAFAAWLIVVVDGRLPRTFHGFLAGYVRYTVHIYAYLFLAADRYPGFRGRPGYDVDLEIDPPARQGRWGAGFRLVLALPALVLASQLTGLNAGGELGLVSLASIAALLGWFAALALGRMPHGLRDAVAYSLGYLGQATSYTLLLTDRYPDSNPASTGGFSELPPHPIHAVAADRLDRSRLTVFFRLLLALPHIVWLSLWGVVVAVTLPFAWLLALVLGRLPTPLSRFFAAWVRYGAHVTAFLHLVGGPFPGFSGAYYPIAVEIERAGRQRRAAILVRGLLGVPAVLLAVAYSAALAVIAILGWFASLVTGRMPRGLRNLGVVSIRYAAQTSAYLVLVTERYPYAAPALHASVPPAEDAV
jgi:Domain of unknown function (DUF4389)